ncbi:hypothetical protein BCU25_022445 [Vibrio cyclitrophicus]
MENNSRPLSDFLQQRKTTLNNIIEQANKGLQTTFKSFSDSTQRELRSVKDLLGQSRPKRSKTKGGRACQHWNKPRRKAAA